MLSALRWMLLIPCVGAVWFYGYAIRFAAAFAARRPSLDPQFHPPVTILKPVCGLDEETYENFASFCRQDYPAYQVLFGVHHARDPGVEIARRVIRDFPQVDAQLVVSDRVWGMNPKVSNLANMVTHATHPLWLIADSDIRVGPDYLRRVVQPLRDPEVGAVTCACRVRSRGWASVLEALRISTEFFPGVLVAQRLEGMTFALGSTTLVRREALAAVGGFAAIADDLADDFRLGSLLARAGHRIELSDYVVEHASIAGGLGTVIQRQIRWLRGVRVSRPWGYLGLLLTYGTPMSLLFLLATRGSWVGWTVLATTWLARLAMAIIVGARGLQDPTVTRYWWLVPVQDVGGFLLWCVSLLGDTIEWRGQRFKLTRAGKLVPMPVGDTP